MGRRALDSGRVGQGPQTTVSLASASLKSRVTWHRSGAAIAEAGALSAAPIAGVEDEALYPGEFPYPSIVTGAVPAGAPMTVFWAPAGAAETTAQTAAVDTKVKTKRFI